MSNLDVETLARELLSAREMGTMVPAPPSSRPGFDFDLDKAYEVESTLKQWRVASGHKTVGRKVGYASKAMWRVLKLDTLAWAHLKWKMSRRGDLKEGGPGRTGRRPPSLSLADLAGAFLRRFPAEPLTTGEIVSSGTLTAGHATAAGDQWTAKIDGLSLPPLTF